MDLKQLEYFVRVAELGSFTRAAAALGVAQPALSRQVRLLEVELRHSLLRRNGRGAQPTEAGALLLEHARGILHQVARAQDELAHLRGQAAGRVALGLPPSVARVLAVPLMQAFCASLPQARLAISEGLSHAMQEALAAGRLDVAVLYDPAPQAELHTRPLASEELLLITRATPAGAGAARATRAVGLAELARLPLIIPARPNAVRMHVEATLAAAGLRPQVAMEVDGVPAILDLVAGGSGCAVLSRHAVASAPRPQAFSLRPIRGAHPRQRLRIPLLTAVSARRPATAAQQALLELIHTQAQTVY